MNDRIHISRASITDLEIKYATDAATNGWGDRFEEYIVKFENMFKKHIGSQFAIATSCGTGALHIGLAALGVGPGDEVILADINWIASAAPITYLGATPVFVDVLEDTWCIDPSSVLKAITSKTKAIIAVHLYGNVCNMGALLEIGRRHNIPVIEDAAESIGSKYLNQRTGSIGAFGFFSFHGSKTISTGEGGMLVTNNQELYNKMYTLSRHGRPRIQDKQFWPEVIGYKYKMTNMQAAIGCAQVERIDELIRDKRKVFNAYRDGLKGYKVRMNPENPGTTNGYWMPTIMADKDSAFNRNALIEELDRFNIDGRIFFWPLSMLPMFSEKKENTVSYSVYDRGVNLPSYYDITDNEIKNVLDIVKRHVERKE